MDKDLNSPIVSIIMPIYNAEKTVLEALNSIIHQTFQDWELLIFDDGSTDIGPDIIKNISEPRIRFYPDSINRGISFRLNQGIELARGKYFARMDSDDIAFPEKLQKQVEFMDMNSGIDLLATGALFFSKDGNVKGIMPVKQTHEAICEKPWNGFYMPHPSWLGRLEWFRLNRYLSAADKAEDQELLFRTYQTSCFACLPNVLLGYRQDQRTFQKIFMARKVFTHKIVGLAVRRRQYYILLRLCCIFPIKILADFLNVYFGFKRFRNQLFDVSSSVLSQWQQVWYDIHTIKNNKS